MGGAGLIGVNPDVFLELERLLLAVADQLPHAVVDVERGPQELEDLTANQIAVVTENVRFVHAEVLSL